MLSASECRVHAKDCRALAKSLDGERRQQALEMAETWEELARQLDAANNRHLAGMLKATYDKVAREPVPDRFRELLGRLDDAESRRR
jgi:hypothetical protein